MIILYDENTTSFGTLGIGVLRDALSCIVIEELNGSFELEMVYPVNGAYYKDISLRKILYVKPNKYDPPQAFRIDTISKPFDGKVTINAVHLSYDLSGYIVEPLEAEATGIQDAFTKINAKILNSASFPFTFSTDITNTESKFNIQVPASVRSILAGTEGSLLDIFGGEYKFDNYTINLLKNRGEDRGFSVRYGKNLTDIKQETKSDKLYTDIYPYFYRIVTETNTSVDKVYQQLYIRTAGEGEEPIVPFTAQWLSLKEDGSPFTPIIKQTPVQIATEGQYYQKIYIWDDVVQQDGSTITQYVEVNGTDYPPNIPNPSNTTTETTEMVTLTNKTIAIAGRESVQPKRILPLDLTQSFNDKPTEQELSDKANEYITNNKIGTIVETVEASFLRINDPSINEAICKLGDTVKVYFGKIGVDSSLQVISTKYDVITEKYTDIGLGTKKSNFSDNALSIGDDISSLNNDANYTDEAKVGKLIAKTITAEYIQATNVEFTNAQITALKTDNILASGIIQAAEASIDTLIAQLLVAEDAKVRNQLIVGDNIVVNGEINIKSGSISIVTDSNIQDKINGYIVKDIDEDPSTKYGSQWLKTSFNGDTTITPDATKIYKVYDIYNVWTQRYFKWNTTNSKYEEYYILPEVCFEVDEEGNLTANSADIRGKITAIEGDIGGCIIVGVPDEYTQAYIIPNADRYSAGWLTDTEGSTTPLTPQTNHKYKVIESFKDYYYNWNGYKYVDMLVGVLQVNEASIESLSADKIIGGTISASSILLQDDSGNSKFEINDDGTAIATSLQLVGGSISLRPKIVNAVNVDSLGVGSITPYSSTWLRNSNGDTIVPQEGVYYKITNYVIKIYFGSNGNYRTYLADAFANSNFIEDSEGVQGNYHDTATNTTMFTRRYDSNTGEYVENLYMDLIKSGSILNVYGMITSISYIYFYSGIYRWDLMSTDWTSPTLTSDSNYFRLYKDNSSPRIMRMTITTNKDAYFTWSNSQNKYIQVDIPNTYFEVDSEGNVTANNVTLTGQIFADSGNMVGITGISTETLNTSDLSACNVSISKDYSDPNNPIDSSFSLDCPIDLNGIKISNSTVYTPVANLRNITYAYQKQEKTIDNKTYTDIILRFSLENHDSNDTGKTQIFFGVIQISYVQSGHEYTVPIGINSNVYLDASKGYTDVLITTVEGGSVTGIQALHTTYAPTQAYVITNVGMNNLTLLLDCDAVVPSSNRTSYLGNVGNEWNYLYADNATFSQININNGNINLTSYSSITGNGLSEISNFHLINGSRVEGSTGSFDILCIRDRNDTVDMIVPTCVTKVTTLGSKGWNSFNLYSDFNSKISTVLYVQYIPHYRVNQRNNYGDRSYEPQVAWDSNNTTIYVYNDWTAGIEVSILVIGY